MTNLTVDELAALWNVKTSWIYARTCSGEFAGAGRGRKPAGKNRQKRRQKPLEQIPHFRPGGGRLLRFDRDEVMAWWEKWHTNGAKPSVHQPEGTLQPGDNKGQNCAPQQFANNPTGEDRPHINGKGAHCG
jgi:hypothetical protein